MRVFRDLRATTRGAVVGTVSAAVAFTGVSIALAKQEGVEEAQEPASQVVSGQPGVAEAQTYAEDDQASTSPGQAGVAEAQVAEKPAPPAAPASSVPAPADQAQPVPAAGGGDAAPTAPAQAPAPAAPQQAQAPVAPAYQEPAYQAPAAPAYEPPAAAPVAPAPAPAGPEINLGRAPVVLPPVIQPKNITFG